MNVHDSIRNSNSWHWLVATIVIAATASVFMPTYGWRDVLAYRENVLAQNEKRVQGSLEELKNLCSADVSEIEAQTRKSKDEAVRARADFAKYGMEELPIGNKAVFSAQSRIAEALNKRNLRLISTQAKVEEAAPMSAPARTAKPAVAAKKEMTPEEILSSAEKAAAKMKDKKMAEMVMADARKTAAKLRATGTARAQKGAVHTAQAAQRQSPARAAQKSAPFKTDTVSYKVSGDFRDMFMFFVGETYKKPYYTFKDIVVENGEGGMELSFQLQVQHK